MADIFISYSKADRAEVADLADKLSARGFSVWWDTELIAGHPFRNAIVAELGRARAVLVLWSKASIASHWVLDEAEHAKQHEKLIAVLASGVDASIVPIGFRQIQAVPIADLLGIDKALAGKGVRRAECKGAQMDPEEEAWQVVLALRDRQQVKRFLEQFPDGKRATEAKLRDELLRKLALMGSKGDPEGNWQFAVLFALSTVPVLAFRYMTYGVAWPSTLGGFAGTAFLAALLSALLLGLIGQILGLSDAEAELKKQEKELKPFDFGQWKR